MTTVTVPVEPTDRMIMATYALGENASAAQIYAAMLAAAPPATPGDDPNGGEAWCPSIQDIGKRLRIRGGNWDGVDPANIIRATAQLVREHDRSKGNG